MQLLDSRPSRMSPNDLDDTTGQTQNPGETHEVNRQTFTHEKSLATTLDRWRDTMNNTIVFVRLHCTSMKPPKFALHPNVCATSSNVQMITIGRQNVDKGWNPYRRLHMRTLIKPLYRFFRDQGYEDIDGRFVRWERDHEDIIGYDDVNQIFWYREAIAHIVLNDKVSMQLIQKSSNSQYSFHRLV